MIVMGELREEQAVYAYKKDPNRGRLHSAQTKTDWTTS